MALERRVCYIPRVRLEALVEAKNLAGGGGGHGGDKERIPKAGTSDLLFQ